VTSTAGPPPAFVGRVDAVDRALRARMAGVCWQPDPRCPPFEALRVLTLGHWDLSGAAQTGQLVVAATLADEVVALFARLFELRFPIARMAPVDVYGGDDDASMAANNTSGFNFRYVAGTDVLSHHAHGVAIDINPVCNPMIVAGQVFPPAAVSYLDRGDVRPGMITRPGPVVELFDAHGWQWGGDWSHMKDYHHFTKPGAIPPARE
jgi:hypothetical protein